MAREKSFLGKLAATVDEVFNFQVTEDVKAQQTRMGNFYSLIQAVASIPAGGTINLGWEIPTPTRDFYAFSGAEFATDNTGTFLVNLNSGADFTGGAPLQGRNRNRNISKVPDAVFYVSPTVIDPGFNEFTFSVNASNTIDDVAGKNLTVLDPTEKWLFEVINQDATNPHLFSFYLGWFEIDTGEIP